MRTARTLLAITSLVAATGCCNVARYLCGPDRSEWVSERYATPTQAIGTFREAVRRADAVVLARSLSERFKATTGLTGPVESAFVLDRLGETAPGFHLLGYAEVSAPQRVAPNRYEFELTVVDRRVRIGVVRQAFWEVSRVFDGDPEDLEPSGENLTDLRGVVRARFDDRELETRLTLELPPIPAEIDLATLQSVAAGTEWKIDSVEALDDDA